jgi:hypothetical protein
VLCSTSIGRVPKSMAETKRLCRSCTSHLRLWHAKCTEHLWLAPPPYNGCQRMTHIAKNDKFITFQQSCGSALVSMRIRLQLFISMRIRVFAYQTVPFFIFYPYFWVRSKLVSLCGTFKKSSCKYFLISR